MLNTVKILSCYYIYLLFVTIYNTLGIMFLYYLRTASVKLIVYRFSKILCTQIHVNLLSVEDFYRTMRHN